MEGFSELIAACWKIKKVNNLSDEEVLKILNKVKAHYKNKGGD